MWEAATARVKKVVFKNFQIFTRKHFVLETLFIEKETPLQVFSCKTCKIFKCTSFKEHLLTTIDLDPIFFSVEIIDE